MSISPSVSASPSLSPSTSVSPSAAPQTKSYISLVEAESDWFITRSGLPQDAPLNEHKRKYWTSKGVSGSGLSFLEMEKTWLRNASGADSNDLRVLWITVLVVLGFTPVNDINRNKFKFYSSVTSNP